MIQKKVVSENFIGLEYAEMMDLLANLEEFKKNAENGCLYTASRYLDFLNLKFKKFYRNE